MIVQEALAAAKNQLALVTDQPLLEAEILLADILKKSRSYFHAWPHAELSTDQYAAFEIYISRRCEREPVAYILGRREFWSLDLVVTKDTLIPRPETELLVETALSLSSTQGEYKIADLGTGSGAIALALAKEKPHWKIYATDVSCEALQIAHFNAQRLALTNIEFCLGNWCDALKDRDLDMILSNPPYIGEEEWDLHAKGLAFEPRQALVAGKEGLDAIHVIADSARAYLKPQGALILEHGFSQAESVHQILMSFGYQNIYSINDLSGHERLTVGQF